MKDIFSRLREVYDSDRSCLIARNTSDGSVLAYNLVRRLKMGGILDEDLPDTTMAFPHKLRIIDKSDVRWEHLNSYIHGNMSLINKHAGTRAFYRYRLCRLSSVEGRDISSNFFLFRDKLCRKLMDQISYVFDVKMYIRDHSNKSNPSTYIRIDLEDKTISDIDGLPDIEILDDRKHKDLLIRSTVLKSKHRYECEHDVAVIW